MHVWRAPLLDRRVNSLETASLVALLLLTQLDLAMQEAPSQRCDPISWLPSIAPELTPYLRPVRLEALQVFILVLVCIAFFSTVASLLSGPVKRSWDRLQSKRGSVPSTSAMAIRNCVLLILDRASLWSIGAARPQARQRGAPQRGRPAARCGRKLQPEPRRRAGCGSVSSWPRAVTRAGEW